MALPAIPRAAVTGQIQQGLPCPVCQVDLVMADRLGVEIDYCPKCRGIWLDRGELDKIIEMSLQQSPPAVARPLQEPRAPQQGYGEASHSGHRSGRHGGSHGGSYGGHGGSSHDGKRRSWLRDLFD